MGTTTTTLILSATVSVLGGLIFGYELGIVSGALLQLKYEFFLTCFEQETLVSSILIGALFASFIGGFLIDRSGRWASIIASNVLVLLGSIILILSGSFWTLIIGRVAIGFAISISSMACCIYISEIVQPHQRGKLVSLYETGITLGILLSYGMNYLFSSSVSGWKYMFLVAIFPALVQLVSTIFLPSKPSKSNTSEQESQNGLMPLETFEEFKDVKLSHRNYSFLDLFRSRDNMRMRTLVGLGLVLFQQLTGQPNVLYYASTIFRAVGFQSNSSAVLASVGLGIVKVLSTLVAMSCADKVGRRILLLAGCIIMTISLTGIGFSSFMIKLEAYKSCEPVIQPNTSYKPLNSSVSLSFLNDTTVFPQAKDNSPMIGTQIIKPGLVRRSTSNPQNRYLPSSEAIQHPEISHNAAIPTNQTVSNWISLFSLMAFVSAFSIGFGPMTWLVLSEIYPAEIRGRAFAFCNSLNWGTNLLITLSFLDVIESIGLSWTFLLYGLMGLIATIFIYFFIPETKGRTLEEIDKQFSNKSFRIISKNRFCWGFGINQLSNPLYERMGHLTTSDSSLSSGS